MTRRSFISFVLLGGLISSFFKKMGTVGKERTAMFWRKKDAA
jgi:hypothetical protein